MRMVHWQFLSVSVVALMIGIGASEVRADHVPVPSDVKAAPQAKAAAAEITQEESARLNAFLAETFKRDLARSPIFQSYLGYKTDNDKFDEITDAYLDEEIAIARDDLKKLKTFDLARLSGQARLSHDVYKLTLENRIAGDQFRYHSYPYNQMFGWHSQLPAFMITTHVVDNKADAEAYISRLNEFRRVFGQINDDVRKRAGKGIVPPHFVFATVRENIKQVVAGAPFEKSDKDSSLLADFKSKVASLKLSSREEKKLIQKATQAIQTSVKPAYDDVLKTLAEIEPLAAGKNNGVWALPDGEAYYNHRLRVMTTTDMTADEIHEFGLQEVARLHEEVRSVMAKVGFEGTVQAFFRHVLADPNQYYPQTEEGQNQYLIDNRALLDVMEKKLPDYFGTIPKAPLELRQVESFRAAGSAAAFYQPPSLDGTRPGYYYVNTIDMKQVPKFAMEAIAYHEALPGHHMQIAINQELKDIPQFRKVPDFTAYIEGWGLYAEWLAKEMGAYKDPMSDFGRISTELWRAARLVVDTGIHSKKWTREQAIQYMDENTSNPHGDNVREVERYFVMPGQATAYKIGMTKIIEAREQAKAKLGDQFDIRDFHDVVLKSGALPLTMMEANVNRWVEKLQASQK